MTTPLKLQYIDKILFPTNFKLKILTACHEAVNIFGTYWWLRQTIATFQKLWQIYGRHAIIWTFTI